MTQKLVRLIDKLLLRKHVIIETITDQLKTSRKANTRAIVAPPTFWSI